MKKILTGMLLLLSAAALRAQLCDFPPIVCEEAPLYCGYQLENTVFNNGNQIINLIEPNCNNNFQTHNSNWFRILPCSSPLSIVINTLSTFNGDGLQAALYSDCNSNATVACNPGMDNGAFVPLLFTASVVPGVEYYLQIDGYNADQCNYVIDVLSGLETAVPPAPISPVPGAITAMPSGNVFCGLGPVTFTASWPGCNTFQSPQLSCYEPEADSCKGLKWTLPPGAVVLGDPYGNPIQVDFSQTPPGFYTLRARPMDCACPDDLCEECGQICCPVEELFFPLTIQGAQIITLPTQTVCPADWPPACALLPGGSVSGATAICRTESLVLCQQIFQPYQLIPTDTTHLGTIVQCSSDTLWVCDSAYSAPGTYAHVCACDSVVVFQIIADIPCNHDCVNYNQPAPPGDDCTPAPLFCGMFLDGYCSSNTGLDADTILGQAIPNAGFIRFTPCSDVAQLSVTAVNCHQNTGISFWVTGDSCQSNYTAGPFLIGNNQTDTLTLTGLIPQAVYTLVFGGDDICEFQIHVVDGIGTSPPTEFECQCVNGQIVGPAELCPNEIATYSLVPGYCIQIPLPPSGGGLAGNGILSCCPDLAVPGYNTVWHIPDAMHFLSDSVNVNSITVQVDSSLLGVDTLIMDSVWISYEPIPMGDDSLIFCECAGCIPGLDPAPVQIRHRVERDTCEITCAAPTCSLFGNTYASPGTYVTQTNCLTQIAQVIANNQPPSLFLNSPSELNCYLNIFSMVAVTNAANPTFVWSGPGVGPGETGNLIDVSVSGMYACTVTDTQTGCTAVASRVITWNIIPPVVNMSPNVTICQGSSTNIGVTTFYPFPVSYEWDPGNGATRNITVSPSATTTYTVTVTNLINGCTNTGTVTVLVEIPPLIVQPIVLVCNENWPPACNGALTVNGNTAQCDAFDPILCQTIRRRYQRKAPIVTNLNFALCYGQTVEVGGETFTLGQTPATVVLSSYEGCDSVIIVNINQFPNCALECAQVNSPAPIGDDCTEAPFLCGNYLDGFCGQNAAYAHDTIGNVILRNGGFLRFAPCSDAVSLEVTLRNCQNNSGLRFYLMEGPCNAAQLGAPLAIANNQTAVLNYGNLTADSTYWLAFGGIHAAGDVCEIQIAVLDGIGTADPGGASCSCTNGGVTGPAHLCPGDVANYTLNLPSCDISFAPGAGGNGYYCCPGQSSLDSFQLVWHIPAAMHFLSDSVNVLSITVQVDSQFLGMNTLIMDSIWVSYAQVMPPAPTADSLVFCDCPSAACGALISVQPLTIRHEVDFFGCVLTCNTPLCQSPDGIIYSTPGSFTEQTNCKTTFVTISLDQAPPALFIPPPPVLNCLQSSVDLTANAGPNDQLIWFGPGVGGASGAVLTVSQPGLYTVLATNTTNGCTAEAEVTVVQDIQAPVADTGPDQSFCAGGTATLSAVNSSPGIFMWSTGETTAAIFVNPTLTTTYSLTVTDPFNGCTDTDEATVTIVPLTPINLPAVVLCEGECYSFYGVNYCSDTIVQQIENCTVLTQEIIVQPPQVVSLGMIGSISCNAPCWEWMGKSYCAPGVYADTTQCVITQFEVSFAKDTQQLGQIGQLTCAQTCINFQGQAFCTPGNYSVSDSCTVYHFAIGQNTTLPGWSGLLEDCLPGNHSFSVGFSITGAPPFKVNGVPVNGAYYLSEPLPNGTNYTFLIEQTGNGCQALLSGVYDCALMCNNAPGLLSANLIKVCGQTVAQAEVLAPPQPGPGDVTEFILHTLSGATPGNILLRAPAGTFVFDPDVLEYGVTYYISSAVGPANAQGQVDFSNACARCSAGQPLVFYKAPEWGVPSVLPPSCFGYSDGMVGFESSIGAEPMLYAMNGGALGSSALFEGLSAGTYAFIIQDANGCTRDTQIVLVSPDSLWITTNGDQQIRQGEAVTLAATTNGMPNQVFWTNDQNQDTHLGGTWTVKPEITTRFTCTVEDADGCPVSASLWVRVLPSGLFHPNVIDPTGSEPGNQRFTIFAAEAYAIEILNLTIFDRWGAAVFERRHFALNDPALGWGGDVRGKLADPAVFAFTAQVLLYDGSVRYITGDVTVVR